MKASINKFAQDWYWGLLLGICEVLKGLLLILTLGHYSTNLSFICISKAARARWKKSKRREKKEVLTRCRAASDGECNHCNCPQIRDGEPEKTGRNCPLPHWSDDPEY